MVLQGQLGFSIVIFLEIKIEMAVWIVNLVLCSVIMQYSYTNQYEDKARPEAGEFISKAQCPRCDDRFNMISVLLYRGHDLTLQ